MLVVGLNCVLEIGLVPPFTLPTMTYSSVGTWRKLTRFRPV